VYAVAPSSSGAHECGQIGAQGKRQGIVIVHAHALRRIVDDDFGHGGFLYDREVDVMKWRVAALRPQVFAARRMRVQQTRYSAVAR
jgi:hypothetical protein